MAGSKTDLGLDPLLAYDYHRRGQLLLHVVRASPESVRIKGDSRTADAPSCRRLFRRVWHVLFSAVYAVIRSHGSDILVAHCCMLCMLVLDA